MLRDGAGMREVAKHFGVCYRTLRKRLLPFPEYTRLVRDRGRSGGDGRADPPGAGAAPRRRDLEHHRRSAGDLGQSHAASRRPGRGAGAGCAERRRPGTACSIPLAAVLPKVLSCRLHLGQHCAVSRPSHPGWPADIARHDQQVPVRDPEPAAQEPGAFYGAISRAALLRPIRKAVRQPGGEASTAGREVENAAPPAAGWADEPPAGGTADAARRRGEPHELIALPAAGAVAQPDPCRARIAHVRLQQGVNQRAPGAVCPLDRARRRACARPHQVPAHQRGQVQPQRVIRRSDHGDFGPGLSK
jgi:hypothetical protein